MLQIIYSNPNIVPATNLNHSLGKSSSNIPLMNRIGTESWLERTKGENRPKAILMDSSSTLINNDENEETEGSDAPADYLLGDMETDEEDLYMIDHENPHTWLRGPHETTLQVTSGPRALCLTCLLYENRLPANFFNLIVHDMLLFYAEQGDVQMAVSILIVLGDCIKKGIDDQTQEHWYMSYIDLLQRFQMWNISNEVIKLSTCRAIHCLNQAFTTLHINCSNCKRPMSNKGWICNP